MAAVLDKKDPAAKFGSQVDEQLRETTSRIRFHDATFGGLVLGAMVLVYATTMILLDRYLVLPEWVRQLSLAGFLLAAAGVAYLTIVRPLRRPINPLYAALQVERTIDDAKNSVVGYVDAREKDDLHPSVKAAMTNRAAKSIGKADINRAVDHRSLVYAGGVVVVFLLALVVLFFVFGLGQFGSLAGRTFVPFTSDAIATRTKLTLTKPEAGDLTVTAGQSVVIAVHVGGKIPDTNSPDRVRLLIRHNVADPNYEPVPLEQGDDSRDWQIRVPEHLVQNGFWYKVAGGDAVTPEYRVTVRSLPLFTDFETTYEYPAYLRRASHTDRNPWLDAPRGTRVVLVARTNREVRDGRMQVEPGAERIDGRPVAGKPDALRFELKLTQSGSYRLFFTSAAGERNADPPPYSIRVIEDAKPTVEITLPEGPESVQPANGQLKVDGTVGDDYGIVKVMLRMRVVNEKGEVVRSLADKPYQGGKPFLREKDNTYPTDLLCKDSVDLAKVTDAKGQKVELKEGTLIEYWLEALDNCTEVKLPEDAAPWGVEVGNVGKSPVKRLRLSAPETKEDEQAKLDQQKAQRQQQEQAHNKQQQDKFNTEDRNRPDPNNPQPPQPKDGKEGVKGDNPPQPDPNQQGNLEAKKNEDGMGQPMGKDGPGDPMGAKPPDGKGENPPPKPDAKGMNDPNGQPNPGNAGKPEEAPPPKTPEDKDVQRKADQVQQEIEKQQQNPGQGRGNPGANDAERVNPDQPKEKPNAGPPPDASQPKDGQNPMNPMDGSQPGESKPEGTVAPPSAPKPDQPPADPMGGAQPEPGQDKKPPEELGGQQAGKEQPEPKKPEPGMQEPQAGNQSAGQGKPASEKKDGDPMQQGTPQPGANKPQPQNDRGIEKDPATQPNAGEKPDTGSGKPEKGPDPAAAKPGPQNDPMTKPDPGQPKPDGDKGPDATDKSNPPMSANDQPPEPGEDKGSPDGNQPNAGGQPDPEKIRDAARNLNNPDEGKRNKAKGELDRELGPKRSRDAQDLADDLNSNDDQKRKDAENKLERLTRDAQQEKDQQRKDAQAKKEPEKKSNTDELGKKNQKDQGGQGDQTDPKDAGQAAKDLAGGDQAKKDAARDKLDKSVGKGAREQIEKDAKNIEKDLKSDDKNTRDAANQKLDELAKKAEQQADEMNKKNRDAQAKKDEGKEPSKEELDALRKKAEDLASDDKAKSDAAEKELDDKIGKENREKLQQAMKDAQSGDPEKRAEAQKKLDEMAKQARAANGKLDGKRENPQGTASQDLPQPKPHEDDPKNRLKSAELQLRKFQEVKDDPELQKRAGFDTPQDYEKWLRDYEDYVNRLRNQVADADARPAEAPAGPAGPVQNVGDARKLDPRNAKESNAGVSGATFAPPGFGNAQQKFQEKTQQFKPKQ